MPKPTPRLLTHEGQTLTLKQWAARKTLNPETIRSRLDQQKWDTARALDTPAEGKFARRGAPIPVVARRAPNLLRHAGSGQAYAKWHVAGAEQVTYFGKWGSAEATEAYARFAAEWAAGAHQVRPGPGAHVAELAVAYLKHVAAYYLKDGRPTSEQHAQRAAVRVLVGLYGSLPVTAFKPNHLKACREAMIAKGWARLTVNDYTRRVTRCFSWGVAEEMVPADVADALAHVPPLQAGRTRAPDPAPVRAVAPEVVAATTPHFPAKNRPVLEAMVAVHALTGCRPGELCAMTAAAVDTADPAVWAYRVVDKNTHRQARRKPRLVWIGPRAQAILRPFLADPGPGGRVWCFPARWPNSPKAKRVPITTIRYSQAVRTACAAAKVEPWTPHQLRHQRATDVQRRYESDRAAAAAIGDSEEVTRTVYADPSEAVAKRIALATG